MRTCLFRALVCCATALWAGGVAAQLPQPNAQVSIGADRQVYYSLKNGEVKSGPRASWDLAFQIGNVPSTILANFERWTIYKTSQTPQQWDTPVDTVGLFVPANVLYNSAEDWFMGAFSRLIDPNNPFDPGWGL
ncbi:MAG: HmuY family protein, partial [Bacteroidia bacterium]|nr:HmuY family protein [Bacteroidia bacterium]